MSAGTTTRARRRWIVGGLLGSATLISGLTVAARLAGFGRTVVFSHEVGAACVGNTYATANLLPNVLYEVAAGGALAAVVVPVLAGPLARARSTADPAAPSAPSARAEVDRIASGLLTWVVVVLAPLSLLLALAAGPLAALTVSGSGCPGRQALAATMILVFAPQVLLYGIGAVLAGVLQAQRRFGWPAAAPLLSSVVVVGAYLGYARSIHPGVGTSDADLPGAALAWLAGGTTLGVAVMTLSLVLPVTARGVRLRPTLRLPPGVARRAAALAGAGIAGLLAQQVFVLATLVLANRLGRTDTLNVFQYVQTVALLPYAVLAVPLATATFPRLAARADDRAGYAELAARSTRAVLLLGALGAALVAGTAPAVTAFFVALDRGRPAGMDGALTAFAPGLVGLAMIAHLGRALYAVERGRTAAAATAAGWLSAALVAAVAVPVVADPSRTATVLAGASTVGMTVAAVGLLAGLRRVGGAAAVAGARRTAAVALVSATAAGVLGRVVASAALQATGSRPVAGLLAAVVAAGLAAVAATAVLALGVRAADPDVLRGLRPPRGQGGCRPAPSGSGGVLFVLGTSTGGVGRHVAAVVAGLRARGEPVGVAAPARTRSAFGYHHLGADTFDLRIADRPRPGDLATALRLGRLARGYPVVHAHGLRAGALAVLGCRLRPGRPVPVVVTLHNALVGGGGIAVVHRLLERIVARGADEVLVVSGDLGRRVRELGARHVERALVPAPGGAPDPLQRNETRAAVRAQLGVPERLPLLLTVARLAPQKGLDLLLDASAGLVGRGLVVVAGEGPMHDELAARIGRDRLDVRLLGHRHDVPALLVAADLVVVPSRWEGQPLLVQEALRAGAAVVATDAGGTAEVAGDAVRLVPGADPAALRDAVLDLLDHPERAADLRRRALARAATLPTDADAVDQLVAVYARLAGRAAPSPDLRDPIR